MLSLTFTLLAMTVASTQAVNNWAVPCTSGSCGYNWAGDNNKTATSSMMLTGPNQVLSDITPAAGWQVMGCNPNWSQGSHNITMVCSGTPAQMALCNHLYVNGGAENTVVRLPQNCGVGPFARVQKTFEPANQSVPPNLTRRGGVSTSSSHPVRGLTLDYDFAEVPQSRGTLSLSIVSASSGSKPLTSRHMDLLHSRGRKRMLAQRGFFGDLTSVFGDVTSAVGSEVSKVTSAVESEVSKVTSAAASIVTNVASHAESAVSEATSAIKSAASAVASATTVNKTEDTGKLPITISNSFPLINTQVGCGANSASLEIDMDTDVNVEVDLGFTIAGTLIPPKIQDLSAHGVLSGNAEATFNVKAQAQGSFDTGALQLFHSGLPGLTIPGIVTLGPEFSVSAELQMVDLELEADLSVTTGFSLPSLTLAFPQNSGKSTGSATQNANNTMKLSASQPTVNVNGTVVAHVIPRMDLGVDFVNGLAKASVFMDVDIAGSVALQVSVGPSAAAGTPSIAPGPGAANSTVNNAAKKNTTSSQITASASPSSEADPASASPSSDSKSKSASASPSSDAPASPSSDAPASSNSPSPVTKSPATPKATPKGTKGSKAAKRAESINGCVDVTGSITVNGGLDGALKPLFNDAVTFPIFHTQGTILKKCFGNGAATPPPPPPARRSISGGSTVARAYRRHEARAAAKPKPAPSSSGTKNDITPQQSKGDKSKLSCNASTLTPLSALLSVI